MDFSAKDDSIDTLVELAQGGCMESFHELVVTHQETIRIYFARNVACSAVSDDLAQEVFIAAFRQLKAFQHRSRFSTWLMGIARNKLLHHLRTQLRRRRNLSSDKLIEAFRERLTRLESVDDEAEQHEEYLQALGHCIGRLPDPARALIEQFYFEGQSSIQMGDQHQCSSGAIRMKLLRIREILQSCILANSGQENQISSVLNLDSSG